MVLAFWAALAGMFPGCWMRWPKLVWLGCRRRRRRWLVLTRARFNAATFDRRALDGGWCRFRSRLRLFAGQRCLFPGLCWRRRYAVAGKNLAAAFAFAPFASGFVLSSRALAESRLAGVILGRLMRSANGGFRLLPRCPMCGGLLAAVRAVHCYVLPGRAHPKDAAGLCSRVAARVSGGQQNTKRRVCARATSEQGGGNPGKVRLSPGSLAKAAGFAPTRRSIDAAPPQAPFCTQNGPARPNGPKSRAILA